MRDASPSEPATREALEFRVEEQWPRADAVVLSVKGEADLHVAPALRERLTAAVDGGADAIVLDLSETTFLDSMAIGVMLGALKRLRSRGGQLRLVVTRPDVRRIFEITLLDRVFALHRDRDEAIAATEEAG